jgi:hypothetical protein
MPNGDLSEARQDNVDILGRQLTELNNRSRWYSTQLWTVPFAYLGVSAVILNGILRDAGEFLCPALFACGLIGVFVVWHITKIRDGEKSAVENLEKLEVSLRLARTATDKGCSLPFFVATVILTASFFLLGILLICR